VVEDSTEAAAAGPEAAAANATEPGTEAPKKKSRRGRRGGRGRRRGPRTNGSNGNIGETQGGNGDKPPPPLAAEGD
jgi:hypothetical protein